MLKNGKKFTIIKISQICLEKKTLITGAGYGIGREIAEKFAAKGHDLFLLIRKKKS